jgi:hypothetical protein
MFDPVLTTDRIKETSTREWKNRPVNTLPLSVGICSATP